eukprot:TRINITY_DN917_c0_g1_i1.p1 TRINITY_DN917_c0_g1~~TRINITY_DN917_c0_g1_i1.p1  ORF type:complete len:224 (+),score=61.92 TRINITY_DN917_c0_g1_i1:741-1412(+)
MHAILNTVISLAACCVVAFAFSSLCRPHHHFDMVDIQNATLAGGVAVGAASSMNLHMVGAMAVGVVAGTISTLGFIYLQPLLLKLIGLHDTCGVHNLHGMPGLLGGLVAVISARLAHVDDYGDQLGAVFPARAHGDRSAAVQSALQLAAIGVTLGFALVGGVLAGFVMFMPIYPDRITKKKNFFNDQPFWHIPDWECSSASLDAQTEEQAEGEVTVDNEKTSV